MKKLLLILIIYPFSTVKAQVSNASELLKVHNITSINNLNNINNASEGNLAYLNTNNKIYKFHGNSWQLLGPANGEGSNSESWKLADSDNDTYIQTEKYAQSDDDKIEIETATGINVAFSKGTMDFSDPRTINIKAYNGSRKNVYIGYNTGVSNSSGSNNVGIGSQALRYNSSGSNNVAVGYKALASNTSGNYNTAVGTEALSKNVSHHQNTAVGYKALAKSKGTGNTAVGSQALGSLTSGSYNTAIGNEAFKDLTTGSNNTYIGHNFEFSTQFNNRVRVGGLNCYIQVAWSTSSDSIFKRDIKPLKYGLDLINSLEVVDYIKHFECTKTNEQMNLGREIGFIAQNLERKLKKIGYEDQGFVRKVNERYSVRYNDFIPLAIKGIQEQQTLIENLEKESTQIKKEVREQQKAIDEFEKEFKDEISSIKSQINK